MDRLDEMARVVRDLAAQVEALRANATGVQARLTTIEGQLAATLAAQADLAGQLEHVRLDRTRLATLERSLGQLGEDRQRTIDQLAADVRRTADEALRRMAGQLQQRSHELAALAMRVDALEKEAQFGTLAGQMDLLGQQLAALAVRLDEMQRERQAIEETARQREDRTAGRLADLQRQLGQQEQNVAGWQARIEAQSETVRQSQALAEQMAEEVRGLQRAQHELAEAQRVWREQLSGSLAERLASWESEWQAFLVQQEQARRLRDGHISAMEATLRSLEERVVELAGQIQGQADAARQEAQAHADALRASREELLRVVTAVHDRLGQVIRDWEADLPYEARPSVVEERRRALRRERRARQEAPED